MVPKVVARLSPVAALEEIAERRPMAGPPNKSGTNRDCVLGRPVLEY